MGPILERNVLGLVNKTLCVRRLNSHIKACNSFIDLFIEKQMSVNRLHDAQLHKAVFLQLSCYMISFALVQLYLFRSKQVELIH